MWQQAIFAEWNSDSCFCVWFCFVWYTAKCSQFTTQFTLYLCSNNHIILFTMLSEKCTQKNCITITKNMIIAMLSRIHDKIGVGKQCARSRHRINSVLYDTNTLHYSCDAFWIGELFAYELELFHFGSVHCSFTGMLLMLFLCPLLVLLVLLILTKQKKYYIKPTQNENIVDSVRTRVFCYLCWNGGFETTNETFHCWILMCI